MAISYLRKQGFEILEKNYYCRVGEIDLIGTEQGYLSFIEVKYRKNSRLGYPEEAVGRTKMRSIIKTAQNYLLRHGLSYDTPCRFDVVVILGNDLTLYRNAFDYNDVY